MFITSVLQPFCMKQATWDKSRKYSKRQSRVLHLSWDSHQIVNIIYKHKALFWVFYMWLQNNSPSPRIKNFNCIILLHCLQHNWQTTVQKYIRAAWCSSMHNVNIAKIEVFFILFIFFSYIKLWRNTLSQLTIVIHYDHCSLIRTTRHNTSR